MAKTVAEPAERLRKLTAQSQEAAQKVFLLRAPLREQLEATRPPAKALTKPEVRSRDSWRRLTDLGNAFLAAEGVREVATSWKALLTGFDALAAVEEAKGPSATVHSVLDRSADTSNAVSAWLSEHGRSFTRLSDLISEHQAYTLALLSPLPEWERLAEKAIQEGYGPLLDPLPFRMSVQVAIELQEAGEPGALAIVEPLLRSERNVADLGELLARRGGTPPARQLSAGLSHFLEREDVEALPLLLVGCEGLFAEALLVRGAAVRQGDKLRKVGDNGQPGKELTSADQMIRDLNIDYSSLITALRRRVFGRVGNPYRHGIAPDGHRERAIMVVASLMSLLPLLLDSTPTGS